MISFVVLTFFLLLILIQISHTREYYENREASWYHIAYLISQDTLKDSVKNSWKLYARNNVYFPSIIEYVAVSTDISYQSVIELTPNMMDNGMLPISPYNLPPFISFNHPLFNDTPYKVISVKAVKAQPY